MIRVSKNDKYISYKNINNSDSKIIFYPELFKGEIFNKIINNITEHSWIISITIGLWKLTDKIYTIVKPKYYSGPIAVFFLEDVDLQIPELDKIHCKKSSVMIIGAEFLQTHKFTLPDSAIQFAEEYYLPDIYTDTKKRVKYASKVYDKLEVVRRKGEWHQCPGNDFNLQLLGKGCYGNVYKGSKNSFKFAIKFSKLTKESINTPYSLNYMCWYEAFFLRDIFKPLITGNICPNLPLLYDTFTCEKFKLTIKNGEEEHPCVVTVVELADGDLKKYLNSEITPETNIDILYSVLFQVMASLWAVQKHAQIIHYDIKKENILFYKIRPGGYFQYTILNKTFYIPNHGYLFILNDFGLSRSVSPKYPMYRSEKDKGYSLGSRFGRIINGKFTPINVTKNGLTPPETHEISWISRGLTVKSNGCDFGMSRDGGIISPGEINDVDVIDVDFFSKPEIIPPFEFYNDTQDVIRMFTGGKRTTQNGFHSTLKNIPEKFLKELKKYIGPSESMKSGKHSTNSKKFKRFSPNPSHVVAGYFITDFFKKYTNYSEKPNGKIFGTYEI